MAVYFKGEIIKEWDIVRGLQVNGHSDISQYQWHTRSQSGSIPPREPKSAYINIGHALRCVHSFTLYFSTQFGSWI